MVNDCAHWMYHCFQLFPVSTNKKFLAFQSSKQSYLKLQLSLVFYLSFLQSFINMLRNNIRINKRFLGLLLDFSATYVAFLEYWFLRLEVWFFVESDGNLSIPLFLSILISLSADKNIVQSIKHWVIWHTISKVTGKIYTIKFTRASVLIKDSFRESTEVDELKMIL